MNAEFQLKLQAYFDGELSAREAREIESILAAHADARALLAELRRTTEVLISHEAEVKLPESREFYWSKIQREIQRQEAASHSASMPRPSWSRFLMPSGAIVALVLAGWFGAFEMGWLSRGGRSPQIETYLADSGAMTYRDEIERTTVVWLSYPAENEFAHADPADTIR